MFQLTHILSSICGVSGSYELYFFSFSSGNSNPYGTGSQKKVNSYSCDIFMSQGLVRISLTFCKYEALFLAQKKNQISELKFYTFCISPVLSLLFSFFVCLFVYSVLLLVFSTIITQMSFQSYICTHLQSPKVFTQKKQMFLRNA